MLHYNRRALPSEAAALINCRPEDVSSSTLATLQAACAAEGGELRPIVTAIEYLRDGLVGSITYGDDERSAGKSRGRDPRSLGFP